MTSRLNLGRSSKSTKKLSAESKGSASDSHATPTASSSETTISTCLDSGDASRSGSGGTFADGNHGLPSPRRLKMMQGPPSASLEDGADQELWRYQSGRRYLKDPTNAYPLPTDMPELHRQNVRTLMFLQLWGAPFCNDIYGPLKAPKKVLEVCCGTGLWSRACHDFFRYHGHEHVSFTGLDLAPVAPDLRQDGVDWHYVHHDFYQRPLPFADGEFDFIFMKDTSFCHKQLSLFQPPFAEMSRLLKSGGVVEVWESDFIFRLLMPNPVVPADTSMAALAQAEANAAYMISATTGFTPTNNPFLKAYNGWLEQALEERSLNSTPCAIAVWAFGVGREVSWWTRVGSRRMALPFSPTRWERASGKEPLGLDQISVRMAALRGLVQFVESMAPLLRNANGMRPDEWERWLEGLRRNLFEEQGTIDGECMEMGAWWSQRAPRE